MGWTKTGSNPATFTCDTGNISDVQGAVDDPACVAGDIVVIPSNPTTPWNQPLQVGNGKIGLTNRTAKNITIKGGGVGTISSGTLVKITGAAGLGNLIHYTCENVSRKTGMISNLELFGEPYPGGKLLIDGEATIDSSYTGGFVMHDVRLSTDLSLTTQMPEYQFFLAGYVFGVQYHCEILTNIARGGNEIDQILHESSPDGSGSWGDYSFFSLPVGRTSVSNSLDAFYFEDCIYRYSGSMTDCGAYRGGGRIVMRHCTNWGQCATHGTRESGGPQHGTRLVEMYNNHYVKHDATVEPSQAHGPTDVRDGEVVCFNNYTTIQGTSFNAATEAWAKAKALGITCSQPGISRWNFGADGLNPWDQNQKADANGQFIDDDGNIHHVYSTYNFTTPLVNGKGDPAITVGIDGIDDQRDHVSGGIDDDPRFGDVWGTVSGGGGANGYSAIEGTITGVTISGTLLPLPLPVNYFRGFIMRNPTVPRTNSNPICFGRILKSTGSTSNSSTSAAGIDLTMQAVQLWQTGPVLNYPQGATWELRKVRQYFGVPGAGALSVQIVPDSDPAVLASGSPNKRFVHGASPGVYSWGNKRRIKTAAFTNEATAGWLEGNPLNPPQAQFQQVVRNFHHDLNWAYNIPSTSASVQPGYPWDNTVSTGGTDPGPNTDGTNALTRVGADWADTYTYIASVPEFKNFYVKGAANPAKGAVPYPHPLRQAPSSAVPFFTYTDTSATFVPGVAETYDITVSGTPTPTLAVRSVNGAIGGSLPTGVTFTDAGGGVGHLTGDIHTVAGTTTLVFRATNSGGTTDSASFSLIIDTPAVILNSPPQGQTLNVVHDTGVNAVVNFSASASAISGIAKVEFYQGTTKLDTETTKDISDHYVFTWSGMADGTYTVKARAYDAALDFTDSLTATVVVSTNAIVVVTPNAPTISVHA